MKNNAKTKISLVSILVILGVAARMMRVIHRQQIGSKTDKPSKRLKRLQSFRKH